MAIATGHDTPLISTTRLASPCNEGGTIRS